MLGPQLLFSLSFSICADDICGVEEKKLPQEAGWRLVGGRVEAGWRLASELLGPGATVGWGRGCLHSTQRNRDRYGKPFALGTPMICFLLSASFSRSKFHIKCRQISNKQSQEEKCWLLADDIA